MTSPADHHFFGPASYRKARPAPVSSGGFHSQRRRLGYSQPAPGDRPVAPNGDMTRRSEKEILQTLNDRFAGYIDKVRSMEMHNFNLEAEAAALRQSQAGRASIGEQYERELGDLRGLLQQLTGEKGGASMEREHLEEDVRHLRARLEDEARHREEVEASARAMKKYVEECRRARLELDKKLRALEEEDAFLRRNHEEEVAELLAQIQGEQVSLDARDTLKADVTGALREIRAQLDSHACKSSTHAEEWFKVRIERLSDAARSNQDALRGTQGEISEYRRQLQSRTIELETLQGTKEALERQCMDSEDRHHDDLSSLQETINQLDNELKATKWEMASQLRDYQELLNVKMALDIEIAAYRKLLEGEENRFVSGGSPYSYLESRISTLFRVKGDEISDTVIVEEQTDETQVTEEEEEEEGEEEEEEGDKKVEQEEAGEDEEETKEDEAEGEEGEEKAEEGEGKEERAGNKGEGEEKGEEEDASEEKGTSPGKSPQPKSPVKSPESKSPAVKSPVSKSPPSKSPESKSPPKTPENEKAKPVVPRETPKEEKKEEKPQPVKEETKEKEKPVKEEKNQEPKEKTTTDKPDTKKEREANEAPKTDDTSKPAAPTKPAEDKPAPKPEPKESSTPATEEKPSPPKPEKAESKPKPAPEVKEEKKEDKKPEEKSTSKAKPESAESKKDEKKPEEKKETSKEESKQVKEGGKAEKSSESKEGKEEKVKK